MNIDVIRAEIPKAFGECISDTDMWINGNGNPDFDGATHTATESRRTAARMLVDWAYEAGLDEGYERGREFQIATGAVSDQWKDGYERGHDIAAKDPKSWYVLDKNGEQLHIGDTVVWDWSSESFVCTGFHVIGSECRVVRGWDGYSADEIQKCEKVIPDTRSSIVTDLAAEFLAISAGDMFDDADELAEQFISRIEALGRNDA